MRSCNWASGTGVPRRCSVRWNWACLRSWPRDRWPWMRFGLGSAPMSAARDFLDALVALGMLKREQGTYANTPATDLYLDRAKPTYLGGMMEMMSARLFRFWANLTEGLKTGEPQNEAKHGGDLFDTLYSDPRRLEQFLSAMTALSSGIARAIAEKFPWSRYQSFVD